MSNNTQLQLINDHGKLYADSRQVAEMVGKLHKNLLKSIDSYVEILGQSSKLSSDDFFIKSSYQAGTGKTYPCYKLTRKGCDMVANKLTGEKGVLFTAEYVTRFEEMEKQLQTQSQLPDFSNPIEMARAWADEMEAKQKALAQIEQDKPKVEFAEAVQASDTNISISMMAKLLRQNNIDIGEMRLFKYLREHKYLCSSNGDYNLPRQRYLNAGYFKVNTSTFETPTGTFLRYTTKVTPKGQAYFIKHFLEKQLH